MSNSEADANRPVIESLRVNRTPSRFRFEVKSLTKEVML
jgi:hypothetical protein